MKKILKIIFALLISICWYGLSENGAVGESVAFFLIIVFVLFVKPKTKQHSAIQEQYLQKVQENIKKSQEINNQLMREKSVVYKDIRKRRKQND